MLPKTRALRHALAFHMNQYLGNWFHMNQYLGKVIQFHMDRELGNCNS
jgi:hypothetical protein